jgi:hypothetical protein
MFEEDFGFVGFTEDIKIEIVVCEKPQFLRKYFFRI